MPAKKTTYAPLTDLQRARLKGYADYHGRNWKEQLRLDWYNGTARGPYIADEGGTHDPVVYGLRNSHGPAWLNTFKF